MNVIYPRDDLPEPRWQTVQPATSTLPAKR